MSHLKSEAEIVARVEKWLRDQGYDTRLELQWRPLASTDLVARRGMEFVAVECKVHDWLAALAQAVPQGKAFDKVYIAAWHSPASKRLAEILMDTSPWSSYIGVLGVTQNGVEVLRRAMAIPGWPREHHHNVVATQFFCSDRNGQVPYSPKRAHAHEEQTALERLA